MDDIPKSPPRPSCKPELPTEEELTKATPEKVRHVKFDDNRNQTLIVPSDKIPTTLTNISDNWLNEPCMNSTYILKNRIDKLAQANNSLQRHTANQVQTIEAYQLEVNEKAAAALNFTKGSKKYSNLTAIDVNHRDVAAVANVPRMARSPKIFTEVDSTDIMAFFTPNLITETPDLDLEADTLEEEEIHPPDFSHDFLFELYRSKEKTNY